MISLHTAVLDLKRLELFADGSSNIHALDARAKVIVTLAYLVTVASCGSYDLTRLILLSIFPLTIAMCANLPTLYLLKKTTLVYPFVFMMGIANSIIDSTPLIHIGSYPIAGGWISLVALLIRSTLSINAVFILIATTSFAGICQALERLGLPDIFATQLLFLYRYIFVLADETAKMAHARELRSYGKKGRGTASFSALTGQLLMRTWQRADRIHNAMLARGFTGGFHTRREAGFGRSESLFLAIWCLLFVALYVAFPQQVMGALP